MESLPARSEGQYERLFRVGFVFALAVSAVCLLSGVGYLFYFLVKTTNSVSSMIAQAQAAQLSDDLLEVGINVNVFAARVALQSCAMFIGMGFGFLGFGLFLLGVRGELDVEARTEGHQVKLARLSPGLFVLLLATLLIGFSLAKNPKLDYRRSLPGGAKSVSSAGSDGEPARALVESITRKRPPPETEREEPAKVEPGEGEAEGSDS